MVVFIIINSSQIEPIYAIPPLLLFVTIEVYNICDIYKCPTGNNYHGYYIII